MFRQGLGDSFLLTFPGDAGAVHVLIDFGVLLGTPGAKAKMQAMAKHIVDATAGKLDYLVATHEHWDHVSGFAQAQEELAKDKLGVGEVWVAWTEKPDEPLAEELRGRRASALTRLKAAAHQLGAVQEPGPQKTAARLTSILEFWGGIGAAGRATTKSAMDWVKERTAPKPPEYLFPGQVFELKGAKGVRVYVLGPPHSKKWIKKSDPTKSASEVYELHALDGSDFGLFSAIDALDAGGVPESQPFDEWFRMSEAEVKGHPFFSARYANGEEWRKIENDWLGPAGPLALQLDSDTNNTSLVLAFELIESGRVLLFPADAQVGNWMSWNDIEWNVEKDGKTAKVTAEHLLSKTVFYKIGHHGSHNATLSTLGLERMGGADGLVAMLPLDRPTAKKMEWNMPFPTLYDTLLERCKGRILDLELGMPAKPDAIAQSEWDHFTGNVDIQPDWVDYSVSMR
jgi:glyoxylase-like metal-dependent hydrolase (beta-lactamase superfamily II)